ncbi:DUF3237 domain-containing protein [Panacibacter ginsenosidivorans]|uniref:UPF0311 protein FRZ67_05920 n=1 Tax=Panacibacter ginsenosidivorans TaxID=1813871 RepID=A0A5B8V612_9BACT|nr:DUF3237 domain-containing protein [Panacibacter ginsenosidivorans]QEC66860.1 DUF3237 domain-containing protein [Panacibacter ginsenosidivorans]
MKKITSIIICILGLCCFPTLLFSQTDSTKNTMQNMNTPQLEFVCELTVNVDKPQQVGETGHGTRRVIPLMGGTFKGPKMNGIILPGGADWQLIKKDGVANIDARYTLQTDDSVLIYISNTGIRVASEEVLKKLSNGEQVDPNAYYFRTIPVFETSVGKYDWLMKSIFIAKGIRNPHNVIIQVWRVE